MHGHDDAARSPHAEERDEISRMIRDGNQHRLVRCKAGRTQHACERFSPLPQVRVTQRDVTGDERRRGAVRRTPFEN